jgi:VCBS repeat protein
VYSGKDGTLLLTLSGEHPGDAFGAAVAGGKRGSRVFLIVGAPGAGAAHGGRSYVYTSLTQKPAFVIEADDTGAALGAMFLSVLGDADGDKIPDIYVSDFSNAAKGPSTGRIYVHSGKDGHRLLTLTGEGAGEGFGIGPANAGDVNHDGHDDLIVGAWQYAGAAPSGGRAYLYSGKDGSLLKTYTGKIPGETFGFDAVGVGDIDGDGTIDLLITSAWSGIKGFHSGRMFVISSGVRDH